jgi:hypothetical protein
MNQKWVHIFGQDWQSSRKITCGCCSFGVLTLIRLDPERADHSQPHDSIRGPRRVKNRLWCCTRRSGSRVNWNWRNIGAKRRDSLVRQTDTKRMVRSLNDQLPEA